MKKYIHHLITFALSISLLLAISPRALATTPVPPPRLMINEVQTGGITIQNTEDGRMEFIELYNPSIASLNLDNWRVEYLSATHDGTATPTRILIRLSGVIEQQSLMLFSFPQYLTQANGYFEGPIPGSSGFLAKSGGHIRIIDNAEQTVDLLTWGSGAAIGEWARIPEIPAGQSASRVMPHDISYVTGREYWPPTSVLTPQTGAYSPLFPPPVSEPPAPNICEGVILSEIMPNAQGTDRGQEFIEIYNPTTTAIRLAGCTLRLGADDAVFELPDEVLEADRYRAFSDSETNIVLPNSKAQAVKLSTGSGEEVVLYPDAMEEGASWALIAGSWQSTTHATPHAANEMPIPQANANADPAATSIACPPGKERNPDTGRCRTTEADSTTITPCRPGQERNSTTNRCRNAVQLTTAGLVPCKPGQERSSETNRCRAVLAAETDKACAAGQERNPATNRCRKIVPPTKSIATIHDVSGGGPANTYKWWIGGILAIGVVGYAVYEWRHDIVNIAHKYRVKWLMKSSK